MGIDTAMFRGKSVALNTNIMEKIIVNIFAFISGSWQKERKPNM